MQSFDLDNEVKCLNLAGWKLRVTVEPGIPNDFGIYNRYEGNSTSAYTNQGRDGFRTWKGKWKEVIIWDRDMMVPEPPNLNCVHVTEVLENGSLGPRHGWLFLNSIEHRIGTTEYSTDISSHVNTAEEENIKADVRRRKEEISELRSQNKQWFETEEKKLERYTVETDELRKRILQLEKEHAVAMNTMWKESARRESFCLNKQKECDAIMYQHDTIHFD